MNYFINRLLQYAQDDRLVRGDDFYSALYNIAGNPDGMSMVWDFYRENFAMLARRLGYSNLFSLGQSIVRFFTNKDKVQEVKDLFVKYKEHEFVKNGQMVGLLERANINVKWIDKHLEEVGSWLDGQANIS